MGGYTVYLAGFRESDFSSDEQAKLDAHISKWSSAWDGDAYKPADNRDASFQDIANTFSDEARSDGKHIIIYQEIGLAGANFKDKFLEAYNDIKSTFSDVLFEAHDDGGKIA